MSIRDLLPFLEYEEIEVDDNDIIVLVKNNKIVKCIANAVILNGRIWIKKEEGIGEPIIKGGLNLSGEGEIWEEYKEYKTIYLPLFDSTKFSKEEMNKIRKMGIDEQIEYANKNPDCLVKLGPRNDGTIVMWEKDYKKEKYYKEQEEMLKNLHIVENVVVGNLGKITYYTLSCRISKKAWNKIKDYFYYADATKFHDEIWYGHFKGWAIKEDKIEELEEILEIPEELRLKNLRKEREKIKKQREEERKRKEQIKNRLEELFSYENKIDIPEETIKEWLKKPIILKGKEINNPFNPPNIYGGGEWFVIQDDCIWRVFNNGHDGDDWSMNFIHTGGAGAYGFKYEKTKERLEILDIISKLNIFEY